MFCGVRSGLHCLPMSLLWDARHKWVNILSAMVLNGVSRVNP